MKTFLWINLRKDGRPTAAEHHGLIKNKAPPTGGERPFSGSNNKREGASEGPTRRGKAGRKRKQEFIKKQSA